MTELTLESLGLKQEELADRLVEALADNFMHKVGMDGEGDTYSTRSAVAVRLEGELRKMVDAKVVAFADAAIAPLIADSIEKVTFQQTNSYGEAKRDPLTFREYLIQRAENYMTEQVNYQGKSKSEDSYSWSPKGTRIAHMIHEHLHYHINSSVKKALADINSKIAAGIQETVKLQIKEVLEKLRVNVAA